MEMTEQLSDTARALEDRIRPQIDEAKQRLTDVNSRVSSFIRENPGASLLGAVAAGYIIARLARR